MWGGILVSKYNFRNIFFLVLVLITFFTIFNISSVNAAPSTVYVNGSGGDDHYDGLSPVYDHDTGSGPKQHIQPAITDVGTDGTIHVAEGTYTELLAIDRNVNLIGNGASRTTLTVPHHGDTAITINHGVDKVFISGFTIIGAGTGVAVDGTGVTLTDNNITGNENGITVAEDCKTKITSNNIQNNNIGINTLSDIKINYNRINDNNMDISTSVEGIDATHNWWGSNNDPQVLGVKYSPWIYMTYTADPSIILNGKTSTLTADFNNAYDGHSITVSDPSDGHIPDGIPVTFTTNLGNIESSKTIEKPTIEGQVKATLTADEGTGTAHTKTTLDNSQLSQNIGITETLYVSKTGNDAWSGTSPTHTTGTTGPKLTIQNAIDTLNSGGIINIANGIYSEHINIAKSLTINGVDKTLSIIDGANSGRVIHIEQNILVNLNKLTIQNGIEEFGSAINNVGTLTTTDTTFTSNSATYGGAIYNSGTLTTTDTTFTSNSATYGGAIFNVGTLTTTDTTFTSNSATYGGAINNVGTLTTTDTTFTSNSATFGGAIYNSGTLTTDTTFTSNSATWGGAIYNSGTLTTTDTTFTSNSATYGGAINNVGTLTTTDTTFTSNSATSGGAIYNEGNLIITNSTLTRNYASSGGAIFNKFSATLNLTGCNLNDNSASTSGGSIYNAGTLNDINSTFSGNSAPDGGAIYNSGNKASFIGSSFTGNSASSNGGALFNNGRPMTVTSSKFNDNTSNDNSGAVFNFLSGTVTANFNSIINSTVTNDVTGGTFNAQYNWWGSNLPDFTSKISGLITYNPWVILSIGVTPTLINGSSTSIITADLNHDSNHALLIGGHIMDGVPVEFSYILGTANPVTNLLSSGSTSSVLSAATSLSGTGYAKATVDGYMVETLLTIDRTIPSPLSFDPINNALNTPVNKVIRVFFSEPVKAGAAFSSIVLKDNYGVNIPIIKSFSPNAYNHNFSDLIITRSSGTYPKGYRYTLTIPINSIMDLAGNGINHAYTDTFTIVTLPPTVTANIKGGYYNTSKTVTLTKNEPGTIYYTTNGAKPTTSSTQYNPKLHIVITSTKTLKYILKDLAGNFSPVYTQKYIIDKIAPTVLSTTPTNLRKGVSKTSTIIIKFREKISKSTYFNNITIKNLTTHRYMTLRKGISLNTLTLRTSTRISNTWYQVTIPKAAIKDYAGNKLRTNYTFRFKTGP